MLFGSFFTIYFFVRVSAGTPWPTPPYQLPVFVAGMNTIILVTSSFTMHWALQSIKRGNRSGLKAGLVADVPARPDLPADADPRVLPDRLHAAHGRLRLGLLRPDRPARRARLRRPDAARRRHDPRLPGPLHGRGAPRRRDPRDLLALRRRDVDRRLHDRLHPLARGQPAQERRRGVPVPARHGRLLRRDRDRRRDQRLGGPRGLHRADVAVVWWWWRSREPAAPRQATGGPRRARGRAADPGGGERDGRRRAAARARSSSWPRGGQHDACSWSPRR